MDKAIDLFRFLRGETVFTSKTHSGIDLVQGIDY